MIARLVLVLLILCSGAFFARSIHHRRELLSNQNTRYAAMAANLRTRLEANTRAQAKAEKEGSELESKAAALQPSTADAGQSTALLPAVAPPDATRHGGWPSGADYFYFPKEYLKYASFNVLNEQRLSDEAAALYNISEAERQEVDRAIGELFAQFRSAESEYMQETELPMEWTRGMFTSGVAYRIPSFASEVAAWRQGLQQQLVATLGSERSQMLASGIDALLRADWNDLGESDRTIGFVWHPESNGKESIWSANRDQRNGAGTFRRYLPGGPDSPTFRHYADLFGIQLPSE